MLRIHILRDISELRAPELLKCGGVSRCARLAIPTPTPDINPTREDWGTQHWTPQHVMQPRELKTAPELEGSDAEFRSIANGRFTGE